MIINDLLYLARQAAGAIAEGIALGWKVAHASDEPQAGVVGGVGIAWKRLADAEAERDVWEPCEYPLTSPPDDVVSADSAGGERPASDSAIPPAADAGHPTSDLDRTLYAGAVGLRMWMRGEPCTAPTYFKSIAADLDTLSK